MRIRKTAAVILALIVAMSLATPAFAATGYGSNTTGKRSPYKPPVAASTPTASNPAPATTSDATLAATMAARGAAIGDGQAVMSLVNVSTVSASTIRSAFKQVSGTKGVKDAVMHIDTKEGDVVLSRIYLDSADASRLSGTVDFTVMMSGSMVSRVVGTFEKLFNNKVVAVHLGQTGPYGTDLKMCVKADLSKLDTKNLVVYIYNSKSGKYTELPGGFQLDSGGYLHFSTPVGGTIIITDKPLARK